MPAWGTLSATLTPLGKPLLMADNITRCPECATAFRISDAHLKSAKGVVRCGSCLSLFNARDHLELRTPKLQAPATPHPATPAPARSASEQPTATQYQTRAASRPPTSFEADPESHPRAQEPNTSAAPPQATGPGGVERRRMPRSAAQQSWLEPKAQSFPAERPFYEEPRYEEPAFEYPHPEHSETEDHEVDDDEAWALELLKDDESELNVQFKKVVPVVSSTETKAGALSQEPPIQALDEELDELLGEPPEPETVAPKLPEPQKFLSNKL